jgi:hypothetical protein
MSYSFERYHASHAVMRMGRQQAERIMEGGKARYYHHAVAWLRRSRAAALGAGRKDDWHSPTRRALCLYAAGAVDGRAERGRAQVGAVQGACEVEVRHGLNWQ